MKTKRVALVTGSSRGIGRAIAERLAADGYAVALNCRRESRQAEELYSQLQAEGACCGLYYADVADYAAVERMAEDIAATLGQVTALVNNAGFAEQRLFTELTPAQWQRMLDVHLTGSFNTCRVLLPEMLRRHSGTIVNIASMWGQVGGSCEVHYSAAKAGLIGLTKALAKEVGPSGIRVNCVAPGVIDTEMMAGFDAAVRLQLAEETPLMRLGTPADVAAAVAFLLSDAAAFITGQVLAPNGGLIV